MAKKEKAVTYDSIYDELFKKGNKKIKNQIAENDSSTDKYVADTKSVYSDTAKQLTKNANRSKSELNQEYQRDYDLNAVSQLVAERQLKEKVANAGLGASGYNQTKQAALAVGRMNADRAVTRQKTAARDTINQNLDNAIAANTAEMQSKISAAIKENDEKNAAIKTAFEESVAKNATSQYNNYLTNQTNSAIAAQESADKKYKIDTDAAAKVLVAEINSQESALEKSIKTTADTIYKAKVNAGNTEYTYVQAIEEATAALTGEKPPEPEVKPERSDNVINFIAGEYTQDEYLRRGKTFSEWKDYIKKKIKEKESNFTDAELIYLVDFYGL